MKKENIIKSTILKLSKANTEAELLAKKFIKNLNLRGSDHVNELKMTVFAMASDLINELDLGLSKDQIAKKLKKDNKHNNFRLDDSEGVYEGDTPHYLSDVGHFIDSHKNKIKQKDLYLALIDEIGALDASDYPPPQPGFEREWNFGRWEKSRK